MSQLLGNIHSIICAFNKYAKDDGECATLSKGELKGLIQKEFAEVIVNPQDPETIETMLKLLDKDCDGKVDFEEFTVLVFKVAKACYKKDYECGATAEGQSMRGGSNARRQETSAQSKGPTLEKVSEPEPQCSSQGEKQESPKSETLSGRWGEEPLKPEQDSQVSQKPAQREREEGQRAEKELPCQGYRREVQYCSKPSQREPQTVDEEISRQSQQEPDTTDECHTQGTQQSRVRKPSQPCQMEEPHKLEQEKPAQQPTPHRKEAPQETQEPKKMEQDAAKPKSQGSQKAVRRPDQRGVQEPQAPEQKAASQSCRDCQEEKPSLGCGKERTSTSEQQPSSHCQEQESPRGERSMQQQHCKPQTGGKGANRRLVEEHQEAKDGSCQQPTKGVQELEPAQSCKPVGGFLTRGKQSTHQLEGQSQGHEQALIGQEEQESQSPEEAPTSCHERQPLVTVRHQPHQDVQKPRRSGKSHECQTPTPEQVTSPQEDTKPWTSEKEACSEPTESTEQTTTDCYEGQRLTRQHETCPEESKPQNTGQDQCHSHECSPQTPEQGPFPQERTTSQKQEVEEAEGPEKPTTAHCECPSLRRRQPCPEESKPQKPGQSQHRNHACQPRTAKQAPSAQEMSQTKEREASCEPPEAPEKATSRGQPSEQCQPHVEEQKPRKPRQSQHRCQESQSLAQEQALSPKEETKPQISDREASRESMETPGKAVSGGHTCQPSSTEQCQSRTEEQRPHKPRQTQHHCHGPQPLAQEQALSPKEETKPQISEREASCGSLETPGKATSGGQTCQPSSSERCQSRSEEKRPHKPRQSQHPCHGPRPLTQEQALSPKEETKPQISEREASCESVETPRKATSVGHACQYSTSEESQTCPDEQNPQKPRQSKDHHERQSSESERGIFPQEETKPCEQEQGSSSQETEVPEGATTGHRKGQSSTARHQPQPEEGKPQNSRQIQYRPHECQPLTPEQATFPQEETKPQTSEKEGSCEPTQSPASQGPRDSSARPPFRPTWPQQHRRVLQFPSPWSPKH